MPGQQIKPEDRMPGFVPVHGTRDAGRGQWRKIRRVLLRRKLHLHCTPQRHHHCRRQTPPFVEVLHASTFSPLCDDARSPWHLDHGQYELAGKSRKFSVAVLLGASAVRRRPIGVTHFFVVPNCQEDEAILRETLEDLGRSPSAKKHVRMVLAMKVTWRRLATSSRR